MDSTTLGTYSAADEQGQRIRTILRNSSRYLIGPAYAETYREYAKDGYLDLGGKDERAIRVPAMAALTTAVALKLGAYDSNGLSASKATARLVNLVRSVAARHRVNNDNTATSWGGDWQTALWAYYAGAAAWLTWDSLSAADREKVVRMLVFEANRLTTGDDVRLVGDGSWQLYMKRRDGKVITPGDSKAEEDSWNAGLLGLAAAMLPGSPDARRWARRNSELLVASAARPADLDSTKTIDGIQLSTWLQGTNIEDDGILRNHHRVHPLYMAAFDQNLYQGAISALGRTCAPGAALHNIPIVYRALVDRPFSGKTIYTPGSPAISYPEGNDWGTEFPFYFGNFDLLVSLYQQDSGSSVGASTWERLHDEKQLALQARFPDGRTYDGTDENNYFGREQRVGAMAAQAFLSLWMARNSLGSKVCWTTASDSATSTAPTSSSATPSTSRPANTSPTTSGMPADARRPAAPAAAAPATGPFYRGPLATTGADIRGYLIGGALLLIGGALMAAVSMHRKRFRRSRTVRSRAEA
ncbi:hypothetical protein CU254_12595 [Amycolatopsis sp. AA4]|uniref:hypothetical protein n=1 Tax=Actinomycetes TaxID=1760 RepID=UPI0001DEE22B|nr:MULTISPECIES: hypothetical protein [Actinomycetes]ATY11212.1 hypothetical protein CU254_12595 [Amycolatopsis sp. AA4]EFL06795.1 predicted protein [Streptomyces sp. AA4]